MFDITLLWKQAEIFLYHQGPKVGGMIKAGVWSVGHWSLIDVIGETEKEAGLEWEGAVTLHGARTRSKETWVALSFSPATLLQSKSIIPDTDWKRLGMKHKFLLT